MNTAFINGHSLGRKEKGEKEGGKERRKEGVMTQSKGVKPCQHFGFRFMASRTVRE